MTPINSTTYLNASACAMNQHPTNNPTAARIVPIVNQSLLPHHSVSKKHPPTTKLATLLATISNPQNVNSAPISELPKYPAGKVSPLRPPCMCVTPPSRGSRLMERTRPPVKTQVMAWPNSWKAMTSILKGQRMERM